jgi:hypothetical protein
LRAAAARRSSSVTNLRAEPEHVAIPKRLSCLPVFLVDLVLSPYWLRTAVERRLREELATLQVEVNEEKTRRVDLTQFERFGFLGQGAAYGLPRQFPTLPGDEVVGLPGHALLFNRWNAARMRKRFLKRTEGG